MLPENRYADCDVMLYESCMLNFLKNLALNDYTGARHKLPCTVCHIGSPELFRKAFAAADPV